jgi:hypothetical protein
VSEYTFTVKVWDNFDPTRHVFIYGKRVDDFLSVNYNTLGILAVGACQTLSKQVTDLQEENKTLKEKLQNYDNKLNRLTKIVESLQTK